MTISPLARNSSSVDIIAILFITICAVTFPLQPAHAAKHAAKVIYSFGDVKAVSKGGSRGLSKGDLVFSGETVTTTRGRAQIKFSDGGFASLQPNTDYQINEYKYEGKADGNERSFLSLLKGSVRLVTGVIGKANRRNFRIKTAVATIGIRGTQGTLMHDPITNTTSLRGHGGEWDLESGNFSGGVPAGQAYSCDGVSCSQVAGVRQRSDVGRGQGKSQRKQRVYQQGQQTDPNGQACDLGGDCGDLGVAVEQAGAIAFSDEDGQVNSAGSEFLENLGVVTISDKPVALVADATTDDQRGGGFVTTDLGALRTAINTFGEDEDDAEFVDEANQFLDELDPSLTAELAANPATVAEEDFATTPDGLVTFGRWTDGNVLFAVKNFETGDVMQRLDVLENFESVHFIYGDNLDDIQFSGIGVYTLTGATYPTAINGSSMGSVPTAGSLTWNFDVAAGNLLLPVVFDNILFSISGSLKAADAQGLGDSNLSPIFTDDSIAAFYTMGGIPMSASARVDGFFTGANGSNAPLAAGLSYAVDYTSNPFVGVAAFGLIGQQTFTPDTTIKYAFNYLDSTLMTVLSHFGSDASLAMGTPLSSFSAFGGDTFNQASATILNSGDDAETGAHFRQFSNNFTFNSSIPTIGGALPPSRQFSFLAVKTDYTTPNSVVASTSGTASYNLYTGAVTMLYDPSGGSMSFAEINGTLSTATFDANFTTGMMDSVSFSGAFAGAMPTPITNFTLNSAVATPINSGFSALAGSCTGCTVPVTSGTATYRFTSAFAGGPPVGVISNFTGVAAVNGVAATISGVAISK